MAEPATPRARLLRFGPYELNVRAGELRKHGIRIKLREQPVQILMMLLENPGEVVLREEIRLRLWPNNTIVEFDHGINAAIQKLRDALSESADRPRYIETVARRGYRFLGELERDAAPAPGAEVDPEPDLAPHEPVDPGALTGATAGHYRILNRLGSGGMGVVYQAEDLTLGRRVALKFLPSPVGELPDAAIRRFEREARAASALSHPNICTVYGFESVGGQPVIAMELVDGESLEERLRRGPLPAEHALRVAIQVADGLAEAHRKRVVHRDLKPGNIMLTKSGVKILDFGLAKLERPEMGADGTRTMDGVVQGTLPYMSPEQARGEEVDWRTDIFSFGALLHEMLTGACPFKADSGAAVMAAILQRDPPPVQPAELDRVVRRCLAKDREERWQSALDLKAALQWIGEGPLEKEAPPAARNRDRRTVGLAWVVASLLALAVVVLSVMMARRNPEQAPLVRFTISPPEGTVFGSGAVPSVSPDGKRIVFATYWKQKYQIWLRSLDSTTLTPLLGPEGALFGTGAVMWSPDSKSIAFLGDSKLRRLDLDRPGGPAEAVTLCALPRGTNEGSSWSRDGVIVFSAADGILYRVADSGGTPVAVTRLDENRLERYHVNPWFLPDGRHFLYEAVAPPFPMPRKTIRLGSLDSPESQVLFDSDSQAEYVNGHILYVKNEMLQALPFDARSLTITGEPVRVMDRIASGSTLSSFATSENGPLVYSADADVPTDELVWFDRAGNRLPVFAETRGIAQYSPQFSPDRKRIAFTAWEQGRYDIWLFDVERAKPSPFTLDPAKPISPVWAPDGRSMAFASLRKGHYDIYRKAADGSGADELLYADGDNKYPTSWSPDGRFLLFDRYNDRKPGTSIWSLPVPAERDGKTEPFPVAQSSDSERSGNFSADGEWVVYTSSESGRREIWIAPFRAGAGSSGGKRQVSTAGGELPRWRGDGREIIYRSQRTLNGVAVTPLGKSLQIGAAQQIFGGLTIYGYDVSPDGQRFLLVLRSPKAGGLPLTVVQNWLTLLKR